MCVCVCVCVSKSSFVAEVIDTEHVILTLLVNVMFWYSYGVLGGTTARKHTTSGFYYHCTYANRCAYASLAHHDYCHVAVSEESSERNPGQVARDYEQPSEAAGTRLRLVPTVPIHGLGYKINILPRLLPNGR